jgi:hypothetical protein
MKEQVAELRSSELVQAHNFSVENWGGKHLSSKSGIVAIRRMERREELFGRERHNELSPSCCELACAELDHNA